MRDATRWPTWSAYDWSDAILEHYFSNQAGNDEPVRVIVALEDEFSDIVGDHETDPSEIVESFVLKTNRSVGDLPYWKKAQSKRRYAERPAYLPYLLLGCVAAIDVEDDDEASFLERFDALTEGKGSAGISAMADLWTDLSEWLTSRSDEYRTLELPDPRGWTRIGHTVRLAFPSRRDQFKLYRCLESKGLVVESPPLGPVLSAVRGCRREFSKRFLDEFGAFAHEFGEGHSPTDLYESPFWGAVSRSVRIRPTSDFGSTRQEWSFVADDDTYNLELRLVSDGATVPPGLSVELVQASGDHAWPFEASTPVSAEILASDHAGLGRLDSLIAGGVIPLAESVDGILQVAAKSELTVAPTALVRDDLLAIFVDRFGGSAGGFDHEGWSVVRATRLHLAKSADLEQTPFASTWILHDAPFPRTIKPIGGIRVDKGFLGNRDILPDFRAFGARAVLLEIDDQAWELLVHDGVYSIPVEALATDLAGEIRITADFPDGTRSQTFVFYGAPAAEDFKLPSDLTPLVTEGLTKGCHPWFDAPTDAELQLLEHAEVSEFLGRDVGVFVEGEADAAWQTITIGSQIIARAVADELQPQAVSSDKSRSRHWRKRLSAATFLSDDDRKEAASAVSFRDTSTELASIPPTSTVEESPPDHAGMNAVVQQLVAQANSRAGFSVGRTLDLLERTFRVEGDGIWDLLRSWMEAGVLEDVISTRFRTRKLFAVQPFLDVFETEAFVGARLRGLSLDRTRDDLVHAAERCGVLASRQGSALGCTPSTVVLRALSLDEISAVASETGIPWRPVPNPDLVRPSSDGNNRPPVTHEPRRHPVSRSEWRSCKIQEWTHSRSPTYWEAVAGASSRWFFHRANAEFASAVLNRGMVVERNGDQITVAAAHLPLPLARRINLVAPKQSGPDRDGVYRYHCPSNAMATQVIDEVQDLAYALANEQEGQD